MFPSLTLPKTRFQSGSQTIQYLLYRKHICNLYCLERTATEVHGSITDILMKLCALRFAAWQVLIRVQKSAAMLQGAAPEAAAFATQRHESGQVRLWCALHSSHLSAPHLSPDSPRPTSTLITPPFQ